MDDSECRAEFERGLAELDVALQPLHDMFDATERPRDGDLDLMVC